MQPDYEGRFFGDQTYQEAFYTATFDKPVKERKIKKVIKLSNKRRKKIVIKPKKYRYSGEFEILVDKELAHFIIGKNINKNAYLVREIYKREAGTIFDLNGILIKIISKSIHRYIVKG